MVTCHWKVHRIKRSHCIVLSREVTWLEFCFKKDLSDCSFKKNILSGTRLPNRKIMVPFSEWKTWWAWGWGIRVLPRLIWGFCYIYQRINEVSSWIFKWRLRCQPRLFFLLATHLHCIYISQPPWSKCAHVPMLSLPLGMWAETVCTVSRPVALKTINRCSSMPFFILTAGSRWWPSSGESSFWKISDWEFCLIDINIYLRLIFEKMTSLFFKNKGDKIEK